jgi:hypothetical protein
MKTVGFAELQFPPERIDELAGRFSYEDDTACLAAGAAAQDRGYYQRGEFLTICAWKTKRSVPRVEANSAGHVTGATCRSFGATDESERMEALLELDGVGVPTGSALLFFAFPGDYPILDVRALESLGVKARPQYSVGFWLDYLAACRALAHMHGVTIRTLDKALWQHSKERAG